MNRFLIKRNTKYSNKGYFEYDLTDSWKTEVTIKRFAIKKESFNESSEVYVAESGYAIYGKGYATEISFHDMNYLELIDFAYNKSKIKEETIFWHDRLRKCYKYLTDKHINLGSEGKIFKVLQFKLINCSSFDNPVILDKRFLKQSTWYYLENDFSVENSNRIFTDLNGKIPGHLRSECFYRYSMNEKSKLLIDVDHFVPKSVGGPGNILENLIPLGHKINIVKSNSIPSFLFAYADEFNIELPFKISPKENLYLTDNIHKEYAKRLVSKINKEFSRAKEIYLSIKRSHFPNIEH